MPWCNLVSAVVRLENSRTPADLKRVVDALVDWLPGPGHREIKRSFGEWIRLVFGQRGLDMSELPSRPQLEEVQTMLADRVNEWFDEAEEKGFQRGIQRGIERGIETGRAEKRALLRRLAERKFGAETAGLLAEILNRVADPGGLADIGESIIECDTGAGLLDRALSVARRSS